MIKSLITSLFVLLISAIGEASRNPFNTPPLDLTSYEYRNWLRQKTNWISFFSSNTQNVEELSEIIQAGERNLQWVEKINQKRNPEDRITLSDEKSLAGIPIESPAIYSDEIIKNEFKTWWQSLDTETQKVLSGQTPLTENPTQPDKDFQVIARKMDRFYQRSTRWVMLSDYLPWLEANEEFDVRGYYFLSRHEDRENFLKSYYQASAATQEQIKTWLIMMCRNHIVYNKRDCQKEFDGNIQHRKDLNQMYDKYLSAAKENWDYYFDFYFQRDDMEVRNENGTEVFTLPFLDPRNHAVMNFIKNNTEDEWRGLNWKLIVDVRQAAKARVEFQKGVTPHVRNGQVVVLDENQSIEDVGVQWMIRHEMGHILGFKDCYLEFYDVDLKAIVSYQLDTSDLMCSRGGKMKARHYEKLKTYYPSPSFLATK